jgi:hypothetical protein
MRLLACSRIQSAIAFDNPFHRPYWELLKKVLNVENHDMTSLDTGRILIGRSEFDHVAIEVIGTARENWSSADVRIACSSIWQGNPVTGSAVRMQSDAKGPSAFKDIPSGRGDKRDDWVLKR